MQQKWETLSTRAVTCLCHSTVACHSIGSSVVSGCRLVADMGAQRSRLGNERLTQLRLLRRRHVQTLSSARACCAPRWPPGAQSPRESAAGYGVVRNTRWRAPGASRRLAKPLLAATGQTAARLQALPRHGRGSPARWVRRRLLLQPVRAGWGPLHQVPAVELAVCALMHRRRRRT